VEDPDEEGENGSGADHPARIARAD
jgi:hypothetical protein